MQSYCLIVISQDCPKEQLGDCAHDIISHLNCPVKAISAKSLPSSSRNYRMFRLVFDIDYDKKSLLSACVNGLQDVKIDFCLQKLPIMKKQLFLADMDSTVILQECIDELGNAMGLSNVMQAITESAMRGECDFTEALYKRVRMLKGMTIEQMEEVRNTIVIRPEMANLLNGLKKRSIYSCLVSGGFTFFAEYFADLLGFDSFYANTLEIEHNRLTGRLKGELIDGNFKKDKLIQLTKLKNLAINQSIAIGDGANDVGMLQHCGLSISMQGKPLLAPICDMQLRHCSPDSILDILDAKADLSKLPKSQVY